MSNEMNLGGRPRHHDGEVKKAAIAVRTSPSIRDALKNAADESGRSITQEVEARLVASFDRDGGSRSPETERLLSNLASEIADIETMTGKRWHKDHKTAGAVLEMLQTKPASYIKIGPPEDDKRVAQAWLELYAISLERQELERSLRSIGFDIPWKEPGGRKKALNALMVAAGLDKFLEGRWGERRQLEQMDFDEQIKAALYVVIENLESIDAREERADKEHSEAIRYYIEAEHEGRELYKSITRQRFFVAQKGGENPENGGIL